MKDPLGLYIHIPFCSKLCHYCDFAKTANFSSEHVKRYMDLLQRQLEAWSRYLSPARKFSSVFFGGGTPGLLGKELEPLLSLIIDMSIANVEITLEANPSNVTDESAKLWRGLGINRLSIGVQSFDDMGLQRLTRDHSSRQARDSLEIAAKYFPKSNGDLIYGWPGQTLDIWRSDLKQMVDSGVNHLSLYALTYEGQTPFARAERRGVMRASSGDELANFYEIACDFLRDRGFVHEEISNWSRRGSSCDHNWLYWRTQEYIGLGSGAHGFVSDGSAIGLRYHYPSDLRRFLRQEITSNSSNDAVEIIKSSGGEIEEGRSLDSWILEYIGCGLRCQDGVDLERLKTMGFSFKASPLVQRAMNEGVFALNGTVLKLSEAEWFRETAWSLEVSNCFVGHT